MNFSVRRATTNTIMLTVPAGMHTIVRAVWIAAAQHRGYIRVIIPEQAPIDILGVDCGEATEGAVTNSNASAVVGWLDLPAGSVVTLDLDGAGGPVSAGLLGSTAPRF